MDKRSIALLEKAFAADVNAALSSAPRLIQTRSKLAEQLVSEGLLEHREVRLGGRFPVTLLGYGLTLLGNLTYCMSVDEMLVPPDDYDMPEPSAADRQEPGTHK